MKEILDKFPSVKALVIGDAIKDVYHFGRVTKLSAEAPIPVFVEDHVEERAGGAGNVVKNLEALGVSVDTLVTLPHEQCVKHRYLVNGHQMFRHDIDVVAEPLKLYATRDWNVIVISDYNKGAVTFELVREVTDFAHAHHIPVVCDTKGRDFGKYHGASVITPNDHEWNNRTFSPGFPCVISKRGEHGMEVITHGGSTSIPAINRSVIDVTGAGDTVTAVLSAVLGTGTNDFIIAAQLANQAAGYVVGKLGTATINLETFKEIL